MGGEGVLIPRPDTERLCEWAAGDCRKQAPRILDLCAGSGCVGLGVASLCPGVYGEEVEWSPEAEVYLCRNLDRYSQWPLRPVSRRAGRSAGRELMGKRYDALLSNPPYIPSAELGGLMREVRREPAMALDGGGTAYAFTALSWRAGFPSPGGFLCCGGGVGPGRERS